MSRKSNSLFRNRRDHQQEQRPAVATTIARLNAAVQHTIERLEGRRLLTAAVGGSVYVDANNNGLRDSGEAGIPGVLVTLETLGTTPSYNSSRTTDGNGDYAFADAPNGTFLLREVQSTVAAPYLDGRDALSGAGGTVSNDRLENFVVDGVNNASNLTFGEVPPATVTGLVFGDSNANGVQDPGELGIPNASVDIAVFGVGDPTQVNFAYTNQATTTDANGVFTFNNLPPGPALIRENPANVANPIPGFVDGIDRKYTVDGTVSNDRLDSFTINTGATMNQVVTFGEMTPRQLSGSVYSDANNNGLRDPGESGIGGVSVTLQLAGGVAEPTIVNNYNTTTISTAADGTYTFTSLPPGNYILTENQATVPPGYLDGKDTVGSSGSVTSNDRMEQIIVNGDTSLSGYLFGERPLGVTGSVYVDANNNGLRDGGETGLAGVQVTLQTLGTTPSYNSFRTTDANGNYAFSDAPNGTYLLREVQATVPAPYLDGRDHLTGAGGTITNDRLENFVVNGTNNTTNFTFGEVPPATVKGLVFGDLNNNGVRDAGEPGIAGVSVDITDFGAGDSTQSNPGFTNQSTTTDANGVFTFNNLPPGTALIRENPANLPNPIAGYLDGIDRKFTVDGTVSNDRLDNFTIATGATMNQVVTFGEVPPATITGLVFADANANGVQDPGEAGISGAAVDIGAGLGGDSTEVNFAYTNQNTTSGINGVFTFNNVPPGTALIRENPANVPNPIPGFFDGIDRKYIADGTLSNDRIENFNVPTGATMSQIVTFGEMIPRQLSGSVYSDANDNGLQDPGEAGIGGVSVTLQRAGGATDPTIVNGYNTTTISTAADGTFTFASLPPGNYLLTENQATVPAASYFDGKDTIGTSGTVTSNDRMEQIIITGAGSVSGYLFGERPRNTPPIANDDNFTVAEDATLTGNVLANDTDQQPDVLSAVLVSGPSNAASFSLNSDGSFSYTPAADYNGSDSFTYRANDGHVNSNNIATVHLSITEVNDASTANPDAATVAEDSGPTTISVTGNDSAGPANENAQTLTVTAASAMHGIVSFSGGNVIYTPDADYNGPDSITYSITDNGTTNGSADPLTASSAVAVTVTEVNDSPTANPDATTVAEDNIATINVASNDSAGPANESGQTLTVTAASALHGAVSFSGGNVTYTPAADYNGPDTISYTITDNGRTNGAADPKSASGTVAVTVTEVNDAPTANADAATVAEDSGATTISVTGNDSTGPANESGQILTVTAANALHGTVSFSGGNVIYTPAADYNGPDTITYSVADNGTTDGAADPKSATSAVTVTVTEVNDAPTANHDVATVAEDSGATTINVLGNDTAGPANESGQALTITSATASHGAVTISGGSVIYTPATDYNGPDTINYSIVDNGTTDGAADPRSDSTSVAVTITEVNDAPIASPDSLTMAEDGGPHTINVVGNDSAGPANESGQTLTVTSATALHGTVSVSGGSVTYTPAADYNGPDTIIYTITDNGTTDGSADPKSASSTVSVTVTEVNDAPTASADVQTVAEDSGATAINVTGNDSVGPANESGQTLTVTAATALHGTVTFSGGNVTYTPNADYNGSDTITYTVSDNGTTQGVADPKQATSTVNVTVTPVNDPPTAVADGATVNENSTNNSINVLANDTSAPDTGETLTVSAVSQASHGTVTTNGTTVTYTPALNYAGTDVFTYTISDGRGGTAAASVSVTVLPSGPIALSPDHCNPGMNALFVQGTSGNDNIDVINAGGGVQVTVNGVTYGPFNVGRVIVYGLAGDDSIHAAGSVMNECWFYGDEGSDDLNLGNGGGIAFGGTGDDHLNGGSGRDILVGGRGADRIVGNPGDDILLAAYTSFDDRFANPNHEDAWCHIQDEWTSERTYAARIDNLRGPASASATRNNATYFLQTEGNAATGQTVFDDGNADEIDTLTGSSGEDWFLFNNGAEGGAADKITGNVKSEVLSDIDQA